jgi:hypothetical protein
LILTLATPHKKRIETELEVTGGPDGDHGRISISSAAADFCGGFFRVLEKVEKGFAFLHASAGRHAGVHCPREPLI